MNKVKFEHDREGYFAVMKSPEVKKMLSDYGNQVASIANGSGFKGSDFSAVSKVGKHRASVKVKPNTAHARNSALKHKTLLKALGAVNGD